MPVEWFFLALAVLPVLMLVQQERRDRTWTEGWFTVERVKFFRHAAGNRPEAYYQAYGTTHTPAGEVPARTVDTYPERWIRARVGQRVRCRFDPASPEGVTLRPAATTRSRRTRRRAQLLGISLVLVLFFLWIRWVS